MQRISDIKKITQIENYEFELEYARQIFYDNHSILRSFGIAFFKKIIPLKEITKKLLLFICNKITENQFFPLLKNLPFNITIDNNNTLAILKKFLQKSYSTN